jgi:hypothetical protein
MFCKHCYTRLDPETEPKRCPRCRRRFDPMRPRTYLTRPFPGKWEIFWMIIKTSAVGFVVAYIIAFFQLASMSGH